MARFTLGLLLAGVVCTGGAAFGQDNSAPSNAVYASDEDYPVMLRPRPEYDAKGIPFGGFRLLPTLALSGSYDDNVLRAQTGALSDYFFTEAPAVRLQSQWAEDSLEFYGGASNYNYLTLTQENLVDWNAGADSRIVVVDGSSIYGAVSAAQLHELLASPNTVGFQKSPNRYFQYHGEASATFQPNRFGLTAGGSADNYIYQDTPLIGGGFLNNKDRSYDEYQGYAKAFYDFSPGYSAFLRGSYDTRQFTVHLDRTGVDRSSNGYRADGGVDLQVSRLVSGEVYVGYLNQDFKAPLKNVSGLDYSVKLDWLATPLLTVHLTGARNLTPTTLTGAAASDDKSIGVSADYEVLRNLIFQGHANFVDSSYPGIARHDEAPDLGANVKFLINEYLSADLAYDYTQRATNVPGVKFQDNTVTVGVKFARLTIRQISSTAHGKRLYCASYWWIAGARPRVESSFWRNRTPQLNRSSP